MSKFDRQYSRFTRRLGKLSARGVLLESVKRLRAVEGTPINWPQGWSPWELLFLMQQAIQHGNRFSLAPWDDAQLESLVNRVKRLSRYDETIREFGAAAFLRKVAYQQFWLQRKLSRSDIGRLWSWFGPESGTDDLSHAFLKDFGLTLPEYIAFAFLTWGEIHRAPELLVIDGYRLFGNTAVPKSTQDAFWATCAADINGLHELSSEAPGRAKKPFLQQFGRSPFIRYPVLRDGDELLPLSLRVVEQHLRWFPFAIARRLEFADNAVAHAVENYVASLLDEYGHRYVREPRTGSDATPGKSPDYVIELGGARLLVEVKVADLSEISAVFGNPGVLYNALRSSVAKGVVQTMEYAHGTDPSLDVETYALIVTPWELDLGPFPLLWESCLKTGVLKDLASSGIIQPSIPLHRIWVASMGDLEFLLQLSGPSPHNVLDTLRSAAEADAHGETQKYHFAQHLKGAERTRLPETVRKSEREFWLYAGRIFHDFDPARLPSD